MSPTCPQTESIGSFIDGELSKEEQAVLEAHIRECAICTAEAGTLTALRARLNTLAVDPAARERVLRGLTAVPHARSGPGWRRVTLPLPAAAGILLLCAVSLGANVYLGMRQAMEPGPAAERGDAVPQADTLSAGSVASHPQTPMISPAAPGRAIRMDFADSIVEFASETRYRFNDAPKIYAGRILKSKDRR